MAKTKVQEPGGLVFAFGTRRRVGAVPGQPDDQVTYEGGCSCGFRTSGWPKKGMAEERITQHAFEHETAGTDDQYTTPELVDYKQSVGYDVDVAEPPSTEPFDGDEDDNPVLTATDEAPDTDEV